MHIAVLVIIVNSVFVKGNSLHWRIYEYVDNTRATRVELNSMSYILQIQRSYIYKETLKAVLHNNVVFKLFQLFMIWFKPANKSI